MFSIKPKMPQCVDEVLAAFHQTISHLEELGAMHDDRVAQIDEHVKQLDAERSEVLSEANRAQTIAAKLREMFS